MSHQHTPALRPTGRRRQQTSTAAVLATLAAVLAVVLGLVGGPRAHAAEIDGAITSITTTASNVGQWSQVDFTCEWAVPDHSSAGDTFTLELPDELRWFGSSTFALRAPDDSVVANAVADDSGHVVFTLTDYVASHPLDVHGTCRFTTQYTAQTADETVHLEFTVNGEVITVPVDTRGPCTEDCAVDRSRPHKWMWWADAEQTATQAVILAPPTTTDGAVVVLTDTPGAGIALDCSTVRVTVGRVLDDGGYVTDPRDDRAHPATVACTPSGVRAAWTDLPRGEYAELRVRSTVTDPSLTRYTNEGTVTIDGVESPVSSAIRRTDAGGDGSGTTPPPTTSTTTPTSSTTTQPTTSTTTSPTSSTTAPTTRPTTVVATTADTGDGTVAEVVSAEQSDQALAFTGATPWPALVAGAALLLLGAGVLATRGRVGRRH